LMCGEAYAQSARMAERMGAFPGYEVNREPMLDVIRMHREALRAIHPENVQPQLMLAAQNAWDTALAHGEKHGDKNSEVTVLAPGGGGGWISGTGHLKMMGAAQPFLSGAISKTINMPEESTVEDIMQAYMESWKMGLKAVAIYRDNSKRSQPLSAAGKKEEMK